MNKPEVTIIDYDMGNLLSVQRALEYCGAKVIRTNKSEVILNSSKVVLPGVGAFKKAMTELKKLKLLEPIKELKKRNIRILGICLGMQLLLDESEEFGFSKGLGLIPGKVVKIPSVTSDDKKLLSPNIGWNKVKITNQKLLSECYLKDIKLEKSFYFVHSYMALPLKKEQCLGSINYGGYTIPAIIKNENIIGYQFHPEKSGPNGLNILRAFCES